MDFILKQAKGIVLQLLDKKPSKETKKIPKTPGVYIIYNQGKIIYVGKGKNLNRRINSDHISGEQRGSTSIFRRKIHKTTGIPFGKLMRNWVLDNCDFAYMKIEDADYRSLVETLTIIFLRKRGIKLFND